MTGVVLTEAEREALVMGITFDCPACGHLYRLHYDSHPGCRICRFPVYPSEPRECPETHVTALGKAMAPAVEAIVTARLAETTAQLAAARSALAACREAGAKRAGR